MSYKLLFKSVIQNKLCCFCGACVAVCPQGSLAFLENGPRLVKPCLECCRCVAACPGHGAPLNKLIDTIFHRKPTDDEEKFGLGLMIEDRNLVSADPEILKTGYTGGKVTTLLTYLLKTKKIDGAIVTTCGDSAPYPHFAWPKVAKTREELLQCSGSKYMFSPTLMTLRDVAEDNQIHSIAFVGIGCHVMGIRKLQVLGESYKHLVKKISYVFGLFCGATMLSSEDFMRLVATLCDTDVNQIDYVDFNYVPKHTRFTVEYTVRLKNGRTKSRKIWIDDLFYMITMLEQWSRCRMCMDYAAEFADISFGGAHIISRTTIGEQLMQNAISEGILAPPSGQFRNIFAKNAQKTDAFMIRLKKKFNLRRIKKYSKKHQPVPEFDISISGI